MEFNSLILLMGVFIYRIRLISTLKAVIAHYHSFAIFTELPSPKIDS